MAIHEDESQLLNGGLGKLGNLRMKRVPQEPTFSVIVNLHLRVWSFSSLRRQQHGRFEQDLRTLLHHNARVPIPLVHPLQ